MSTESNANTQLVRVALAIVVIFALAAFFLADRPSSEGDVAETVTEEEDAGNGGADLTDASGLVPVETSAVGSAAEASYASPDGVLAPDGERGETRIWSEAPATDMNGDGTEDHLVIIEVPADERPTGYYVATLLSTEGGYMGGVAMFIGQGVAIQNYGISGDVVRVNYADRYPWETADVRPSVGKTKVLTVTEDGLLARIEEDLPHASVPSLAELAWDGCDATCVSSAVAEDGIDGVWYLKLTQDVDEDDSLRGERRWYGLHRTESGTWSTGALLRTEYVCREGRGQQDFATDLCV